MDEPEPLPLTLDVYELTEDWPVTCPRCGSRTNFADLAVLCSTGPLAQIHWCLNTACGYTFKAVE